MTITWYTGSITTAVADAKAGQASLLVFVRSDDQYTKMYDEVILLLLLTLMA